MLSRSLDGTEGAPRQDYASREGTLLAEPLGRKRSLWHTSVAEVK